MVDGAGKEVAKVTGLFELPEVSNLVTDLDEQFEVNISYSSGEEHRDRLHAVLMRDVTDHIRSDLLGFVQELKER